LGIIFVLRVTKFKHAITYNSLSKAKALIKVFHVFKFSFHPAFLRMGGTVVSPQLTLNEGAVLRCQVSSIRHE